MKEDKPLEAIAGAPDRPLVIGDIEIPCYVLEDETRVLSQGGFLRAIGRSRTPKAGTGGAGGVDSLPTFLASKNLKPFIDEDLKMSTTPISFQLPGGGRAFGYRAQLLPEVCNVYLKAREARVLLPRQKHIAERVEILIRGLAVVGIIGLVDEATGYQQVREQRALAAILEKYLAEELQPWTKTFPYEFYEQIFRLKSWPGPDGVKRPSVIGRYTNDIVYARLAPGVLKELQTRNPTLPSGRRGTHHHRWFNPESGHPELRTRLEAVMALMRASPNWDTFMRLVNRAYPKPEQQIELPLAIDEDGDG